MSASFASFLMPPRLASALFLAALGVAACRGEAAPSQRTTILWAWDRPEDVSFLGAGAIVASLQATFTLRSDDLTIRRRSAPHVYPADAERIDVVRIEVDRASPPTLSARQTERVARALDGVSHPGRELQIDFDATVSQRPFYRALLTELRSLRGHHERISITALASWCFGDPWIADLPVDDAIPMLFRLGVDETEIRRRLARGEPFRASLCQQSLGIATDEPISPPRSASQNALRVFVFHPSSWTAGDYRRAISALGALGIEGSHF